MENWSFEAARKSQHDRIGELKNFPCKTPHRITLITAFNVFHSTSSAYLIFVHTTHVRLRPRVPEGIVPRFYGFCIGWDSTQLISAFSLLRRLFCRIHKIAAHFTFDSLTHTQAPHSKHRAKKRKYIFHYYIWLGLLCATNFCLFHHLVLEYNICSWA